MGFGPALIAPSHNPMRLGLWHHDAQAFSLLTNLVALLVTARYTVGFACRSDAGDNHVPGRLPCLKGQQKARATPAERRTDVVPRTRHHTETYTGDWGVWSS